MFNKKNSLFITFIPKSGTDFISNNFLKNSNIIIPKKSTGFFSNYSQMGFHDFNGHPSIGMFDTEFINWKFIKNNINKSCLFKFHASGNYFNRMALAKSGVRKLTVVIRDPRDVTVSFYYHIIKSKLIHRNYMTNFLYFPLNFLEINKKEQLKFLFRTFYPKAINWIESWIYSQIDEPNIKLQFIFFNEIRENPLKTIKKIAKFHDINLLSENLVKAKETGHFRKGIDNQIYEELPHDEINLAKKLLDKRIHSAIDFISERRINLIKKTKEIDTKILFDILYTFPSQKKIYKSLVAQIKKQKTEIDKSLTIEYERFLRQKNYFYRPYELLKQLRKFI